MTYLRPRTAAEALKALAGRRLAILAGGTDFYPARVGKPLADDVLDVTGCADLRGIAAKSDHWRIGASTTWTLILEAKLPPLFDGLKLAAREIGGLQIQNSGTLAGNLCNASPAADGVPPLLALDASVELASVDAVRRLPLADFLLGPRKTVLRQGELLTAVLIPRSRYSASSHFLKLGARKYLVISIAMASAVIEHRAGRVTNARIAIGACSPVAVRLLALEAELRGQRFNGLLADRVSASHLAGLAPITDVRASAEYREHVALELLRRLLREMA